jgi:NADP-dependent 3-hydroxy acid dehydrogenase YdfG
MQLDHTTLAVVTGAGSGIGAALARHLDRKGVRLALCDIHRERLDEVAAGLAGDPLVETVDVADKEAIYAFAARVHDEAGVPDLVIANAGVSLLGDFDSAEMSDWEWVVDINFWGVVHTNRAFLSKMVERDRGTVVNISSIFGIIGVPNCAAYCAAKSAVKGFSESIQQELQDTGVRVACVHPGGVATNITRDGRVGSRMFGRINRKRSIKVIERGIHPDEAAQIILGGVERGRLRILVGRDAWLIDKIQRVAPVRYRKLLRRLSGL